MDQESHFSQSRRYDVKLHEFLSVGGSEVEQMELEHQIWLCKNYLAQLLPMKGQNNTINQPGLLFFFKSSCPWSWD